MSDDVSMEALQMATAATAAIDKHEGECGLRYEGIAKEQAAISAALQQLKQLLHRLAWGILSFSGAILVALLSILINQVIATSNADRADRKAMDDKVTLLTQQLQWVQPRPSDVAPGPASVQAPFPVVTAGGPRGNGQAYNRPARGSGQR